MTNHVVRLYTAAGALIAFFLLWATIAAHPWATAEEVAPQDPRLLALAQREKKLQKRAAAVKRTVDRRWTVYERRAGLRQQQNALALRRYLRQLEASRAAAVRTAEAALAQTEQARAYAASVVAWANQQRQPTGSGTSSPAMTPSSAVQAVSATDAAPSSGRSSVKAPERPPAAGSPKAPVPSAPIPAASPPAAPSGPSDPPAPVASPTTAAPPPSAAPPPVAVVALPPVTTTKVSKKK